MKKDERRLQARKTAEKDLDEEGRPKLINVKYFGGVYDGSEAITMLLRESG